MSLAKLGREYLSKNPNATADDLVEHCGFKKSYAIVFMHEYKRKSVKKTRTVKKDVEVVKNPTHGAEVLRKELAKAHDRIDELEIHLSTLIHQAIGYRAVISFLEDKLED